MKPIHNGYKVAAAAALIATTFMGYGLFAPMGSSDEECLCIHRTDNAQTVKKLVDTTAPLPQRLAFHTLATVTGYYNNIRPGRYEIANEPTIMAFRRIKNGSENPVTLTIPSTLRTVSDLADFLGKHLEPSAEEFLNALTDDEILANYNLNPETATCLFLPNTYEVYWSASVKNLMDRMQKESDAFWTESRMARLKDIAPDFTCNNAITLASIVEQETQYGPERADVAGMYINRLHMNMPLQADPTVKFAIGDFSIKRILHKHLETDSPYNTYRNTGLPPGPICIPSLASIDAVLNYKHHSYVYMCAKEDFSGAHNFATTYNEHLRNAARYAKALDAKGIK